MMAEVFATIHSQQQVQMQQEYQQRKKAAKARATAAAAGGAGTASGTQTQIHMSGASQISHTASASRLFRPNQPHHQVHALESLKRAESLIIGQKLRKSKWFSRNVARDLNIFCAVVETGFIVERRLCVPDSVLRSPNLPCYQDELDDQYRRSSSSSQQSPRFLDDDRSCGFDQSTDDEDVQFRRDYLDNQESAPSSSASSASASANNQSAFGVAVWEPSHEKSKDPTQLSIYTVVEGYTQLLHRKRFTVTVQRLTDFWPLPTQHSQSDNEHEEPKSDNAIDDITLDTTATNNTFLRINNRHDRDQMPLDEVQIRAQLAYAIQNSSRNWHNTEHFTYFCRYGPPVESGHRYLPHFQKLSFKHMKWSTESFFHKLRTFSNRYN